MNQRAISVSDETSWSIPATMRRWAGAWAAFWFTPTSPVGMHAVRFMTGLLLMFWLAPMAGQYGSLFGYGWVDRQAYLEMQSLPGGTPFPVGRWSLVFLVGANPAALALLFWGTLAVFGLFTLGIATRVTGVLTWILVVSNIANPALHYDVDYLLVVVTFYLMVGYLLFDQWSGTPTLVGRAFGSSTFLTPFRTAAPETPSYAAALTVRLLQVHFVIVILSAAFHKTQSAEWWTGAAFWYWLNRPETLDIEKLRAMRPFANTTLAFLSLATYATLAWQFTFPLFAFRPSWRPLLLGGAILGWLGLTFIFGLPYFGPLYMILCLNFLTPPEWSRLLGWFRSFRPAAAAHAPNPKFRPRVKA